MIDFGTFKKLPKNVGKIIVDKGFEKLHKVQKIAQSGHTVHEAKNLIKCNRDTEIEWS